MANSKAYLGNINIGNAKLGTSDVKLYLGDVLVYPLNSNVFIVYDVATYNGMLQTAQNIIVTDESGNTLVENVDYVVTENNGGTNAGAYDLVITLMGQYYGTKITDFVINKVTPTVTAPTAKVLTYNTQSQELVNAGSTDYGTLKYSIDNSTWSTSIPTAINYGSYTVYYEVEGDSNVNDVAAQSVACSINEKQVTATVELSQNTYTYNGSACQPTVTVKDGSTVIDPSEYTVAYSNNINVGTATVTINDNTGGNYEVIGSATFTINKVTPTVTAPTAKVLTYNTQSQELVNAGSTDYGTLKYSIDGTNYSTMIPSVTTAGSYTVYYKVDGDSNINDVAAQNIACSIAKASGSVTTAPTAKNLTYNGNSRELINAGSGTGTMMYKLDNGSWSTDIPSATTAGTYTVYYKASASTNYEESSSGSVNCVIAKANSSLSFTVTNLTVGIGETKTNAATVNAGDGTVTYVSSDPSIATVDNSGNVSGISSGNTTVSANISSTSNYKSATTSYNVACAIVVITKFNVTSTTSPTRIASGTSNFSKIEIDGVVQPSVSTGYTFSTTGEHTVKYHLKSTSIGWSAFASCSGMTSIDIPDSVTSIGESAFYNCTGLTSIDIPDSVTSIGNEAFRSCYGLTSCTIGSGVTSIGTSAFTYCSGLTSVTIGSGVTSIGASAFTYCTSLTSIDIPDSVTSIGNGAFSNCTSLTSCTIGDGVTSIGNGAFSNCTSLTSIDIPDSVTSIGGRAFNDCYSLTSCTIGSGVTSIGYQAFSNCTGLTSIDIPDSVTSIGSYAFESCTSLTSCTIGSGVTSIGNSAFINCSGLTSCSIGNGVTSIGDSAFTNCTSLTSCTIGDGVTSIGNYAFYDCSSLTSIDIPNSVTSIDSNAFYNCSGLTSVTIGSGVTSIGSSAFRNCTGLTSIEIPDSVTSIDSNAFEYCYSLTSCTIGSGVTSIGGFAFYLCRSLTSIDIPDSVTSIGGRAFNDCYSLTSCTIGSGVTSIGYQAFSNCTGLTSIDIPDSVTSIGNSAFTNCTSLTSCTIGDGVTSIGNEAFSYCKKLISVTVEAITPPTLGSNAFMTTNNCPIYVPCDSVNAYKAATNWSTYASRIQAIPGSCS